MKTLLFSFPGNENLGAGLAGRLDYEVGNMELRHFPDGETYLRILSPVAGANTVIVCSLHEPDSKMLPLLMLADTLRAQGAAQVGLVAPYLCYMRQDKAFRPGESVTAVHFASLLSPHFNWLITVDPHLHRIQRLDEIYALPSRVLQSCDAIADWIVKNVEGPMLIGPDIESSQWVSRIASRAGAAYCVLQKTRISDYEVRIELPDLHSGKDHTLVLVDDIISSGNTMIRTIEAIVAAGFSPPICIGIHAIFAGDAYERLLATGSKIITTNTISHPSNQIAIDDVIAGGIQ